MTKSPRQHQSRESASCTVPTAKSTGTVQSRPGCGNCRFPNYCKSPRSWDKDWLAEDVGTGMPRVQNNSRPSPFPRSRTRLGESGGTTWISPTSSLFQIKSISRGAYWRPAGKQVPKVTRTTTQLLGQAGRWQAPDHGAAALLGEALSRASRSPSPTPPRSRATRLLEATMPTRPPPSSRRPRSPLPRGCLRSPKAARAPRGPR